MTARLVQGAPVVVGPAHSHETRRRTVHDAYTGAEGEVVDPSPFGDADVLIWFREFGEVYVNRGRLKAAV